MKSRRRVCLDPQGDSTQSYLHLIEKAVKIICYKEGDGEVDGEFWQRRDADCWEGWQGTKGLGVYTWTWWLIPLIQYETLIPCGPSNGCETLIYNRR